MCQGNNYQFDTLRRAKHSSMMILWHLHNPSIPAYAHVCNVCETDISCANRHHCEDCCACRRRRGPPLSASLSTRAPECLVF